MGGGKAVVLVFIHFLLWGVVTIIGGSAEYAKYKDPKQHLNVRINDLLGRMTIEEKVGQVAQIERSVASAQVMKKHFVGSVLSGGGSVPRPQATAKDWIKMVNGFQRGALATRLGIPMIYGIDAVHGHNNMYKATVFPHNIGLGATRHKVSAYAKHYLGDGGTHNGINENNTIIDARELFSIHLPAYCNSIIKGVSAVMISYSSWNGKKMHSNHKLVTDVLQKVLRFRGFVISDWQGIDRLTYPTGGNYTYSVEASVGAGLDRILVP